MKRAACNRAWAVEAVLDGRLDGSGRASLERHLSTCATCSRHLEQCASLASLGAGLPEFAMTPLDRRRIRASILNAANARILREPSSSRTRWVFAIAALSLVAIAAVLVVSPRAAVAPVAAPPVVFDISPVGDAVWEPDSRGARARVTLRSGALAVHVEHLTREQQFLVGLPDGELEVRGTRFVVRVEDHRTRSVEVSEGMVALRLLGEPERSFSMGQRWELAASPVEVPRGDRDPSVATASTVRSVAVPAPARGGGPRLSGSTGAGEVRTNRPAPPAASAPAAVPTARPAAERFAEAMTAFDDGSYGRADQLFSQFSALAPDDSRREDAAFLRAVARARLGDRPGAAALARIYLATYPHGLRRSEAEQLVRAPAR